MLSDIHDNLNEGIYELKDENISVFASIGMANCPEHSKDPRELVHQADLAMYQAKHGDKSFVVYSGEDRFVRTPPQARSSAQHSKIRVENKKQVLNNSPSM